jgi:hypothetical protein
MPLLSQMAIGLQILAKYPDPEEPDIVAPLSAREGEEDDTIIVTGIPPECLPEEEAAQMEEAGWHFNMNHRHWEIRREETHT